MQGGEKRKLKARAQHLDPMLKLGQDGVTDAFLASLDEALTRHGLVKIKFAARKDEKKNLAPQIAERTGSELITRVGNVAVFFRREINTPPVNSGQSSASQLAEAPVIRAKQSNW